MQVIRNEETPISKKIMEMADLIDHQLPKDLHLEEVYDLAALAWNVCNFDNDMKSLINDHEFKKQLELMMAYKKKHFLNDTRVIVHVYIGQDDRLYVESQDKATFTAKVFEEAAMFEEMTETDPGTFEMIDRNAVLVAPKKPFFAWVNKLYPERPIKEHQIKEHNIYLIHELDSDDDFEEWLEYNYLELFENELFYWHMNPQDWPEDKSLATFKKWFRVQYHSMVLDFEEDELIKE